MVGLFCLGHVANLACHDSGFQNKTVSSSEEGEENLSNLHRLVMLCRESSQGHIKEEELTKFKEQIENLKL